VAELSSSQAASHLRAEAERASYASAPEGSRRASLRVAMLAGAEALEEVEWRQGSDATAPATVTALTAWLLADQDLADVVRTYIDRTDREDDPDWCDLREALWRVEAAQRNAEEATADA
jgi:hypothetical protein